MSNLVKDEDSQEKQFKLHKRSSVFKDMMIMIVSHSNDANLCACVLISPTVYKEVLLYESYMMMRFSIMLRYEHQVKNTCYMIQNLLNSCDFKIVDSNRWFNIDPYIIIDKIVTYIGKGYTD